MRLPDEPLDTQESICPVWEGDGLTASGVDACKSAQALDIVESIR